jgi:hypothetical protein
MWLSQHTAARPGLAVLLALLTGCTPPAGTRVDPPPAQSSGLQQPTVFGKFDLSKGGKAVKVSQVAWLGVDAFTVLLLPEEGDGALSLLTDAQGWFAWNLKPGRYTVRGYVFQGGGRDGTLTGTLSSNILVTENDKAIYIGHIELDLGGRQSAATLRDAEEEAAREFTKRNPHAAPPAKRLLEPERGLGDFSAVTSICAEQWGAACTRELHGIEAVQPAVTRGIHGSTFTRVADVNPTLRWKPSTMPDVKYDLVVWEAAAYRLASHMVEHHIPGRLHTYREGLEQAEASLALKPKTRYFWSVRLRKGDAVSTWSRAGHFAFLVVGWTSSRGGWFAFETP